MEEEYDMYKQLASVIFDIPLEEITKEQRQTAKSLMWSWAYSIRTPTDKLQKAYETALTHLSTVRGDT